jgi:hypothetical protein
MVPDVLQAVSAPVKPGAPREAIGDPTAAVHRRAASWAQGAEQRFRVIYGSAIGSAVVVAALLAVLVGPGGGGSTYYDPGYEASASTGSGYDADDSDGTTTEDAGETYTDTETETTETDGPDTREFTSAGSTWGINPPSGWVQDDDETDKGKFRHSRWHLSGSPDVFVVLDTTPGYSGTPEEGAASLRKLVRQADGYVEQSFESYGDDQWQLEWTQGGDQKIDIFSSRCGDGYGALGSAPEDEFEKYREDFTAFADSLVASCESDGSTDEGTTTEETPADTGDEPEPGTSFADSDGSGGLVGAEYQTYPTSTRTGAMEQTVRRHFQARIDGDYGKAYGFYGEGSPLQQKAGNRAGWISNGEADGLQRITIEEVKGLSAGDSSGGLLVRFRTESSSNGCKDWSARYTLRRLSGIWRMWTAKSEDSSC